MSDVWEGWINWGHRGRQDRDPALWSRTDYGNDAWSTDNRQSGGRNHDAWSTGTWRGGDNDAWSTDNWRGGDKGKGKGKGDEEGKGKGLGNVKGKGDAKGKGTGEAEGKGKGKIYVDKYRPQVGDVLKFKSDDYAFYDDFPNVSKTPSKTFEIDYAAEIKVLDVQGHVFERDDWWKQKQVKDTYVSVMFLGPGGDSYLWTTYSRQGVAWLMRLEDATGHTGGSGS